MSRVGAPRNATKAEVRIEERAGSAVVVKDYGARARWVRLFYGRPTLRREARVYGRLAGVTGIPRCLGFEGPDALVLERVPGEALDAWKKRTLPEGVFDRLDETLAEVHARGVAIADLHRSNVIVDASGALHLVDFAIARIARDPARPGALLRALFRLDRHAAARIRARALGLPEPEPGGVFGTLYRAGRGLKRCIRAARG